MWRTSAERNATIVFNQCPLFCIHRDPLALIMLYTPLLSCRNACASAISWVILITYGACASELKDMFCFQEACTLRIASGEHEKAMHDLSCLALFASASLAIRCAHGFPCQIFQLPCAVSSTQSFVSVSRVARRAETAVWGDHKTAARTRARV